MQAKSPFKAEFLAGRNLMPDARSYYGIAPFKVVGAGNRHVAGTLKLQTQFAQIDSKRAGRKAERAR